MLMLLSSFASPFTVAGNNNVTDTGYGQLMSLMSTFIVDADENVVFIA